MSRIETQNYRFLKQWVCQQQLKLKNEENFETLIFQKNLSGQLQKCGNIVSNVCIRVLSLWQF